MRHYERGTPLKWTWLQVSVTFIPAPSFILCCQLGSCALFVKVSALAGLVDAEPLEWEKSKKFALIVFGFIGTLFSNVTALQVNTIVVILYYIAAALMGSALPCTCCCHLPVHIICSQMINTPDCGEVVSA